MDNAELIQSLEWTKTNIENTANAILSSVKDDGMNPLKLLVQLKAMQKVIEKVSDELNDLALDEAEKYGKNEKVFGATINIRESGVRYSFDHSAKWCMLTQELKNIKEKIKQVEDGLKSASEGNPYFDDCSGELIYTPAPKASKTTIAVTF